MPNSTPQAENGAIDFDGLFRLYARELNSFAYRRLNDREAAADVVQDGFLRFLVWHRERRTVTGVTNPRFFLWSVVGNRTLDLIRRRRLALFDPMTKAAEAAIDPAPGPDRWLEGREQYRLIREALNGMPTTHRTALLLNRLEGLTHAEIAVRLGVSTSMVTKYVVMALETCAAWLGKGAKAGR
jgi:RNA polymerase sigma-70 factor (ECF subfamily)